jgi:hypothetical protein
VATLDYQPCYVGQTYPSWHIPLQAGGVADNLNGVDITKFTLTFRTLTGVDTLGTGTITLDTAYPAYIFYKPSIADVTTMNGTSANGIFNGSIIVKALFPPSNSTADEAVFDPIPFNITPS